MNLVDVRTAVEKWAGSEDWYLIACEDQPEPDEYIWAFEDAMGTLVSYSGSDTAKPNLALALPFGSTLRGEDNSYRRVLKKYTRSTVFIDLNISLMLVQDDGSVMDISAEKVNAFLEDLNPYIARAKMGDSTA